MLTYEKCNLWLGGKIVVVEYEHKYFIFIQCMYYQYRTYNCNKYDTFAYIIPIQLFRCVFS